MEEKIDYFETRKNMKVDKGLITAIAKRVKKTLSQSGCKQLTGRQNVPLWVFLVEMLQVDTNGTCVRWNFGLPYEFVVTDPQKLAFIWGYIKKNPKMTYTNLCRAVRYYYRKNIIEKVCQKSFTYRFVRSSNTEPFLAQCFPNQSEKCALMKEPEYIKIHRYVSINDVSAYETMPGAVSYDEEGLCNDSNPLCSEPAMNPFSSEPKLASCPNAFEPECGPVASREDFSPRPSLSLITSDPMLSPIGSGTTVSPTDSRCSPNPFDSGPALSPIDLEQSFSPNTFGGSLSSVASGLSPIASRQRLTSCTSVDSTSSGFEEFCDCNSVSSGVSLELALKDGLLTYHQKWQAQVSRIKDSGRHQPPDKNMFWLINLSET